VEATTVSLHQTTSGADGEETTLESILVDQDALARTESGASDYLARAATECLIDEFVNKGRGAALEQLRRRQPKRALAKAQADGPRLKSAMIGVDPAEVEKVEQQFARDREILLKRVFGDVSEEVELDAGVTKDRIRQIGKRASKVMAELAETEERFAVMADYRGQNGKRLAA
jgi:RNA polymerase sigma-32 factor